MMVTLLFSKFREGQSIILIFPLIVSDRPNPGTDLFCFRVGVRVVTSSGVPSNSERETDTLWSQGLAHKIKDNKPCINVQDTGEHIQDEQYKIIIVFTG